MHRKKIQQLLKNYKPFDDLEANMHKQLSAFVDSDSKCFDNLNESGHITASAWVIDLNTKMVCLVHHSILNRWFQPGGHSDGNPDTPQEALREAKEELGIDNLTLKSDEIFDIDIHQMPPDKKRGLGKHLHYDLRFLVIGNSNIDPICSHESHQVKWVALADITKFNDDEAIQRMATKSKTITNSKII